MVNESLNPRDQAKSNQRTDARQTVSAQCQPTSSTVSRCRTRNRLKICTGANGVVECFSAANINTAMTNVAVINISMNTPWAEFIPCCRNVLEKDKTLSLCSLPNQLETRAYLTLSGPGVRPYTMADAAIAPTIWAMQNKTNRTGPTTPTRKSASVMLGLNNPPVTR